MKGKISERLRAALKEARTERIVVTESELLAELRRDAKVDDDVPPDAMTVADLCRVLDVGPQVVTRMLGKYRAQGRLREFRVYRPDGQGRPHRATAYVLLPAEKSTSRKRAG